MKRTVALILAVILIALAGCQARVVYCPECGEGSREGASFCSACGENLPQPTEPEEYCKKCGQLLPAESEDIPQRDAEKIELARDMMIERWQEIAGQDEMNDGYFEIKNTRIVWLDGVSVEVFSTVYYPDCMVEFDIYTDYRGAAPYYFETEYQNDVIFYIDGTSEINEDIAEWLWDPEEFAGRYTVTDYGDAFNLTINLFSYIPEIEVSDEAPAWDYPADAPAPEAPAGEAPQELLPKDDTNYSILDMGACNGNVYWEIRSNGVLYIDGEGTIPSYENREVDGEIAPWRKSALVSEITDVVIGDGITGIGECAFYNMKLKSISFGHNVITYIGNDYVSVYTAYIPASMKDVENFLGATYSSWVPVTITIYYEGTEEQWQSVMGYQGYNDNTYVMHYNYNY